MIALCQKKITDETHFQKKLTTFDSDPVLENYIEGCVNKSE